MGERNAKCRAEPPAHCAAWRRALGVARAAAAAKAFALAVALAACSRGSALETGPTARVERGRIERVVVATGTIEPEKEVEVRSRISGIVDQVHVEAGDVVVADQPLVEIERDLLEAQAAEARARLAGSRAGLTYAQAELKRAVELRRGGTLAARDEEDAVNHQQGAAAAVARDQAALDSLLIQLRYTTIVAPMQGRILDVDVKKGSAVASVASVTGGTRVLTIADDTVLHLKGLVDENEIAWVAVGEEARIKTEAHAGRSFAGQVRKIKPIGERQQNVTYFEVEVLVVDRNAASLRPRMSADADIVTEVVDEALIVPEAALLYDGDHVYVEKGGPAAGQEPAKQLVRVGIVEKGRAQVLEGLAAGEEIRLK
jgi:HlyD family secretion protein